MKLTPATLAWEAWRAKQRLRRRWLAWSSAVGAALIVVAVSAWSGIRVFAVGEQGEAVAVKLGNPEGENLPLAVQAVPDPSMQAVLSAQREAVKTEETRVADDQGTRPVSTPKPSKTASPSSSAAPTSAPASAPASTAAPKTPQVTEKVIRGDEKGNPYELVLKPQGEKISQNVWTPVWLFMPLPTKLDAGLIGRIQKINDLYTAQERKDMVRQMYPDGVTLQKDPGLDARPAIWAILESAGYPIEAADYKKGKNLKPVIITFELGIPPGPGISPKLLKVSLEQRSGNPEVDAAVLYAFQRSSFANGTGQTAQGRYTYNFDSK